MKHIRIGQDGLICEICGATENVNYPICTDVLDKIGTQFQNKHLHKDFFCMTCNKEIKLPNDLWCDECFLENLK